MMHMGAGHARLSNENKFNMKLKALPERLYCTQTPIISNKIQIIAEEIQWPLLRELCVC
jgi:hypothetical protein